MCICLLQEIKVIAGCAQLSASDNMADRKKCGVRVSAGAKAEERNVKKPRCDVKERKVKGWQAKQTKDCLEALLKCGLVEPDVWHLLRLDGDDGSGHTVPGFMEMLDRRAKMSMSLFGEVGKEGGNMKMTKGCIKATKPTRGLLKELLRIVAFLALNEVESFAMAAEDELVEKHKELVGRTPEPSDALLTWMSGVRVADLVDGVPVSVNFPEMSVFLMNVDWGVHNGETLKATVDKMVEFNESSRLWKWVPMEHMVAVMKAVLDLKESTIPRCEVDLLCHSPGESQRKELFHFLAALGVTKAESEAMMRKEALFGDCSYVAFVNYVMACFHERRECAVRVEKMLVLARACGFMERGMKDALKIDRILRFGHSGEFQKMAEHCQLPEGSD